MEVSALALGSWRTYERISREQAVAVMRAAQKCGATFLDDARYNDETWTAPIPTGYSEVVFGESFRAAGWRRDEVVVANKLWWEFWPEQSAVAELGASLTRMGFNHIDILYSWTAPDGPPIEEIVDSLGDLIRPAVQQWRKSREPRECLRRARRSSPTTSRSAPTSKARTRSRRSMLRAPPSSRHSFCTAAC